MARWVPPVLPFSQAEEKGGLYQSRVDDPSIGGFQPTPPQFMFFFLQNKQVKKTQLKQPLFPFSRRVDAGGPLQFTRLQNCKNEYSGWKRPAPVFAQSYSSTAPLKEDSSLPIPRSQEVKNRNQHRTP